MAVVIALLGIIAVLLSLILIAAWNSLTGEQAQRATTEATVFLFVLVGAALASGLLWGAWEMLQLVGPTLVSP